MSLYHKLKALHPSLTDKDFLSTVILNDDGRGPYIDKWDHPTLVQPTQAQIDSAITPSQASIDANAEIDAAERSTMLPRVVREFMLGYFEANATPAQRANNPGYAKVKALDDSIKVLRTKL